MSSWKTRSVTPLLTMGHWLAVESHEVELPDGQVIDQWPWVITPDFVNVLAVNPQGQALMFRQEKYGLAKEALAPVGGYIEPGEDPLAAAQRELLEETGCEAEHWTDLGSFLIDPNRGVCTGSLFLARGVRQVAQPTGGDLEAQELVLLSLADLKTALLKGEIATLAWAANVALALVYLDQNEVSPTS